MDKLSLDQILVTPLERIKTPGGDVMHAMKKDDVGYAGFGEAYFSWVGKDAVKAWKMHQRMTLNLVVPIGEVQFVFCNPSVAGDFRKEVIGASRYVKLTVPPGIWFGFQGLAGPASLVLNIANIQHDKKEYLRRDVNAISFDWRNHSL